MAPAARTKRPAAARASSRSAVSAPPRDPRPWWGDGDAPHVRWPGVTIELAVRWVPHGTLRCESRQDGPLVNVPTVDPSSGRTVMVQEPSVREVWLADAREVPAWERAEGGRWESVDGRFYFDMGAADAACEFFPDLLRHHIGEFAGRPFELMEYQRKLLTRPLFGWKRVSDDLRRFRKIFGFLPKGAGKSPWAAGTGVYLARCDGEMAAEVYALANDRNQARTVHTNAKYMVEDAPLLSDGCEILKDSIYWTATRSAYMVLSSDASSAHGKRPHGLIFDELHVLSGDRDRELFEALKKSLIKRRQPVLLMISHSGTDDEGLCVAPDTKLLTADLRWVRAGDVSPGDVLAGFDEHRAFTKANQKGVGHRKWRTSTILQKTTAVLPSYELRLSDGTTVVCSADHMWLVQTAGRRVEWRKTKDLTPTDSFSKVLQPWETDKTWGAGYLAGVLDSEGHLSATDRAHLLCGFTQCENELSDLGRTLLADRGLKFGIYETTHADPSRRSTRRVFQTMVTRKRDVLRLLGSVRPPRLLRRFAEIGWEHLRFKSYERPVLVSKQFVGDREVVGLKTTTRTYVAEGLASHNCHEEYEYAKGVLSGSIPDETHLPVIFEIKPGEDWTDPAVHARVNPGYGITVKADAVETECLEAQTDPRKQNDYKRYHCNAWVNQATAWIPVEWWDACNAPLPSDAELQQYPCATGTDMAQKIDLAAHVIAFKLPLEEDEAATAVEIVAGEPGETDAKGDAPKRNISLDYRVVLVPAFFLPEDTLHERVHQDRVPYDLWAQQEPPLLTPIEGAILGSDAIVRHIVGDDGKSGNLKRFPRLKQAQHAYDPAFATDVALALRDGSGLTVVEVLQNYKHLSEACQVFEALVKAKRIVHGGHKLLRWNLENVAVKRDDAGRIRPVKPKRQTKRIDGVVAAIMAISRLMLLPPARRKPRGKARIWTPNGFVPAAGSQTEARV